MGGAAASLLCCLGTDARSIAPHFWRLYIYIPIFAVLHQTRRQKYQASPQAVTDQGANAFRLCALLR
jgi:hypothetical protein